MYFLSILFIGGGIIFLFFAVSRQIWPLLIVGVLVIGLGYAFYRTTQVLVTIDETSISVYNGFVTKSALLVEVAGFRRGDKNTLALELKSGGSSLTIPGTVERRDELEAWVEDRYPDIAALLVQEVTEEVLHDERYGLTEEDRARRLKQARKIAGYTTAVMPFLFFLVMLRLLPFGLLMFLLLAFPLAAVALTWYYQGILRLYLSKSKPYPSLLLAIIFAEVAAFIAVYREYNIYVFDAGAWELVLAFTVVMTLVWAAACRKATAGENNLFVIYAVMLLLAGVFSYNALLFSNCGYDHHKEVIWRVGVDGKHISRGKSTSYYLNLSPWGRFTEGENVKISSSLYHEVRLGDSVNVYLHPGKWGIPWYEVMAD